MPYSEPDPSDPQMLVGVLLPGSAGATREMAAVFAEELARLGYSGPQILAIFSNPFYAGTHAALRALGEPAVRQVIVEALVRTPQVRVVDAPGASPGCAGVPPRRAPGGRAGEEEA
jgi:hypothetical protein